MAGRILTRSGSRSERKLIPYDQAYAPDFEDMHRRVLDIRKVKAVIGWQPAVPLDQTIDEVMVHFRREDTL